MNDGLHAAAEDRSIELHRAVAARLGRDPAILERARERVAAWLRDNAVARTYARWWSAALALPLDELAALLVDPGEQARQMRQTSPFAGALPPRERWEILRRHRERPSL